VLEPGEKLAVEVVCAAGVAPEIWEGDISCLLYVEASALASNSQQPPDILPRPASSGGESEELLAEHPTRWAATSSLLLCTLWIAPTAFSAAVKHDSSDGAKNSWLQRPVAIHIAKSC
jgi:hypothetical protein